MKYLFDRVSKKCSKLTTETYSTSFSFGIKSLHKSIQQPIYNIYGFVRFADEIVDSFHKYNKAQLLIKFKKDTFSAIENKISLNPIINSFQETVNQYNIDKQLITQFFKSMEMDLKKHIYNNSNYNKYIYGSAKVVGLMCLHVFVDKDKSLYNKLKGSAMSLGAAFQKINFLRDISNDMNELGRVYFPDIDMNNFTEKEKGLIEEDIKNDFKEALIGIRRLPYQARGGVYLAYIYYYALLKKISTVSSATILEKRIRISNFYKINLMLSSSFRNYLNLI